jgi:predicted nucleotide-binding protein
VTTTSRHIDLLDSLINMASDLASYDEQSRDALMKRSEMIIRRICGNDSDYVVQLKRIRFRPMHSPHTPLERQQAWGRGIERTVNLIRTIKEEIELFGGACATATRESKMTASSSVFVVHGHDEAMKQSVARTLERLHLTPIILHEQPNRGRTIIEKFSAHADVAFAVVLMSADDVVVDRESGVEAFRARQNVILELGFFLGRLGRERVAAIYRPHENFEMPSDYSGVLYIEFDPDGAWQYKLAKELRECGHAIDLNAI